MQRHTRQPAKTINGECMAGTIHRRKDSGAFYVQWYDSEARRQVKIYRYRGEKIFSRKTAAKLLAVMQAEVEKKDGSFNLEKYTKDGWTDVLPLIDTWAETTFETLKPATEKGYRSYLKNWIKPFFKENPVQLHEIQIDVLTALLHSIKLTGKGKQNVMYCFHAFLDYCWRSRRIVAVPPFPKKREYNIIEPVIRWLPEARQMAVLEKIPNEHKPIFYFLKYTMRRPAEAMSLHREDIESDSFIIRRSISARKLVESTKTGGVHYIPCHEDLEPFIKQALKGPIISQYVFTNSTSKLPGGRYSSSVLNRIWRQACQDAGESIDLYSGLKHSSLSQYHNEKGLSLSDCQILSDHARYDSVKRYAKTEMAEKRRLMMAVPISSKKSIQNR